MKSEEKLNELFKTLREEEVSTTLSEVTFWINTSPKTPKSTSVIKTAIAKKTIIMSSIITSGIIGSIFLFTGKQSTNPNAIVKDIIQENRIIQALDSTKNLKSESKKNENVWPKKQALAKIQNTNLLSDSTQNEHVQNSTEEQINSNINTSETYTPARIEKSSGYWRSLNGNLHVDTLFRGVKFLVFKGNKSDISVRGSKRSDISMNFNHLLKAKGFFVRKKDGKNELSYELKDSVLTVHLKIKRQIFSGVSTLSETSKMEFNVPENMDVRMDSDLGDISVNGLQDNSIKLHTSLGKIAVENCSGRIDLNTDLGTISMKNLEGIINSFTSMGDILGENIMFSNGCNLNTSLGNIKIQLNNPLSECNLKLSTSLGHIKVDRADLQQKSKNKLTIGSGELKGTMTTSLGKIILR
jgi:hypothetical protein